MPNQPKINRPHIIVRGTSRAVKFKAKQGGGNKKEIPAQDRHQHAAFLQQQIKALKQVSDQSALEQEKLNLRSGFGIEIQFTSQPDVEMAFESLAHATKKIELLSVLNDGSRTLANVFVPNGELDHFETYIEEYKAYKKGKKNQSLDHRELIDAIESILPAKIKGLWTDAPDLLPTDPSKAFLWEVWLPVRNGQQRQLVVEDFKKLADMADCLVYDMQVNFPERTVLLMYGSQQKLSSYEMTLNCVAEFRYAKDSAEFFDEMEIQDQRLWAEDLQKRTHL